MSDDQGSPGSSGRTEGGWQPPPPPPPPPPPSAGGYTQPPAPPQPPYAQPPYGQAPPPGGYGQPQYGYQPYPAPQTEGGAIGALIASIVAWMVCPVIPAIVALVLIPGSRKKIEESGGRLTGDGLLTAAKWVSWINIGFYGLVLLGVLALIVIAAITGSGDTSSDFSLGALLQA